MDLSVFDLNLFTGALIPALTLGTARYFFQLWGHDAPLPRSVSELIQRYVWGTGSILLGDAIWLSLVDRPLQPFEVIAGLCVITAASGAVVVLRYISDHLTRVAKKEPLYQDQVEKLERTRE